MSAVPAAAAMVESAPAVPSRAPASKLGRAEDGMKAPSARPAKKARKDAFDPMDPVSVNICLFWLKHDHTCRICPYWLACMHAFGLFLASKPESWQVHILLCHGDFGLIANFICLCLCWQQPLP